MKPELEKLCAEYIANREEVKNAFRWDSSEIYSVCANIFCACGRTADADTLKVCRRIIKNRTRPFSRFRGKVRPILSCMLSMADSPEDRMALANEYYAMLKRYFRGTEYLVLTSFLLADLADISLPEEKAARGKEIFSRMNQKHRILTNKTDSVFSVLMSFSGKTDDALIEDMESCYSTLKKQFQSSDSVQMAAQVLSMSADAPEQKAQRVIDLYNNVLESGVRYGRSRELAPLAALSLADVPMSSLAEEIREAYEFLEPQKYYGSKEADREQRAMHAVMIVSDQYTVTKQVNSCVMTNTLEMLISKHQASRFSLLLNALQFLAKLLPGSKEQPEKAEKNTPEETGAERPAKK